MIASRMGDFEHAGFGVWLTEGGEPFDVGHGMLELETISVGNAEDRAHAGDA